MPRPRHRSSSGTKNKRSVTNGKSNKFITKDIVDLFLQNNPGWRLGITAKKSSRTSGCASTPERELERRRKISETMKKNPAAGGLREGSGRGKKTWYNSKIAGKVYLRSTYELAYAKFLDEHNIRWRQNLTGFKYIFNEEEHTYYPDFYLIDEDMYVEIKGFIRKNDEYKWSYFPYKLKILMYEDLVRLGISNITK